jgi:hypothetical protein
VAAGVKARLARQTCDSDYWFAAAILSDAKKLTNQFVHVNARLRA